MTSRTLADVYAAQEARKREQADADRQIREAFSGRPAKGTPAAEAARKVHESFTGPNVPEEQAAANKQVHDAFNGRSTSELTARAVNATVSRAWNGVKDPAADAKDAKLIHGRTAGSVRESGGTVTRRVTESATATATVATAKDGPGEVLVRIIDEGVGSSGTYTRAILEQAAKDKVFPKNTAMHLNHDTETELMERPGGSLRNMVGALLEDARYQNGALFARARIGSKWRHLIEEFHDVIGVSINAAAEVDHTGTIARLVPDPFNRVDLVTVAGRGGRVEALLEAARNN
ncbi:hypothetical protein [Citricoccus sp. GCM10030269]|uniref:hypothetical protein n=1 Tax=Citricoccus sp. GCM10030269 TaxID=3273388 RepID=UPI00360F20FD